MKAKNRGPLSDPDLMHIAQHSVENSHDLLDESAILLEAGRWARAAALAVLALEESGKAQLCHIWSVHIIPSVADATDPAVWSEFWKAFSNHERKLDLLMSRAEGAGRCGEYGAWDDVAFVVHTNKIRCLYVDWVRDGARPYYLIRPSAITEQDARDIIDYSLQMLRRVENVADSLGSTPDS